MNPASSQVRLPSVTAGLVRATHARPPLTRRNSGRDGQGAMAGLVPAIHVFPGPGFLEGAGAGAGPDGGASLEGTS